MTDDTHCILSSDGINELLTSGITRILGYQSTAEHDVDVSCLINLIDLKGGPYIDKWDTINIPIENCDHNIHLIINSHTKIYQEKCICHSLHCIIRFSRNQFTKRSQLWVYKCVCETF